MATRLSKPLTRKLAQKSGVKLTSRPNKYGAVSTQVDGYTFDSKKEAHRYGELKILQRAGKIEDLRVHPAFPLKTTGGRIIGHAEFDFEYFDIECPKVRCRVIEDVKTEPTNTKLSAWKRKHFELQENIAVRLV